jgi:hypothetical protein
MGAKKNIKAAVDVQEKAIDAVTKSQFVGKTNSEEILVLLQEIKEQNRIIKRRMMWMVVGNYLRLLLIVLPLIVGTVLAYVYLPSFLQNILGEYQQILGGGTQVPFSITDIFNQLSPEQIEEAAKLLK